MATLRALAAGDNKERRTSSARIATKRASTQLGTWRTFVRATMKADGSGTLMVERTIQKTGEPPKRQCFSFVFNPESDPLTLEVPPCVP